MRAAVFERRELPFTHWVDEQLLSVGTARRAGEEFPPPGSGEWHTFTGAHEAGKGQCSTPFGPVTTAVLAYLRSEEYCAGLEQLTGLGPLTPDVIGGGMHQTAPGGRLDVHVDFNQHPANGLRRALNLLVYLNADWQAGDGGELELWDGAHRTATIAPVAGRGVLFPTSDTSWHGHPNPVAAGRVRRSIAVYYFTPGDVARPHSTEWLHA